MRGGKSLPRSELVRERRSPAVIRSAVLFALRSDIAGPAVGGSVLVWMQIRLSSSPLHDAGADCLPSMPVGMVTAMKWRHDTARQHGRC